MDMVLEAVNQADPLIAKAMKTSSASGWDWSSPKELRAHRRTAKQRLEDLRTTGKKYEAELISREVRV